MTKCPIKIPIKLFFFFIYRSYLIIETLFSTSAPPPPPRIKSLLCIIKYKLNPSHLWLGYNQCPFVSYPKFIKKNSTEQLLWLLNFIIGDDTSTQTSKKETQKLTRRFIFQWLAEAEITFFLFFSLFSPVRWLMRLRVLGQWCRMCPGEQYAARRAQQPGMMWNGRVWSSSSSTRMGANNHTSFFLFVALRASQRSTRVLGSRRGQLISSHQQKK